MNRDEAATTLAKRIISIRSRRKAFFDPDLFDEEPWDLLLLLFVARQDGEPIDRDGIRRATGASAEILDRWIRILADQGILTDGAATAPTPALSDDAFDRMCRLMTDDGG